MQKKTFLVLKKFFSRKKKFCLRDLYYKYKRETKRTHKRSFPIPDGSMGGRIGEGNKPGNKFNIEEGIV